MNEKFPAPEGEWAGAAAFIQHAQNAAGSAGADGHWPDEFLAWYKPDDWAGEHRAAAVFIGGKIAALAAQPIDMRDDVIATLRGQLVDLQALCDERGRKLYGDDDQSPAEGDGMLKPLIYAAMMHNGKPKTVAEFERAAATVADMLERRAIAQPLPEALPHPGSPEADKMLDALLAEYGQPVNMKNAARAGYMAARRLLQHARQPLPATDDAEPNVQPKNMTTHTLKTDPAVFADVLSGAKTFEIRFNDRDYQVGDVLQLQETENDGADMKSGAPLIYTGREVTKTVSHILTGYGLAEGWCCLSFAPEVQAPEGAQLPEPAFTLRWDEHSGQYKVNKPGINYAECYTADQMRAALAAPAPQAPVALTDEQIRALRPLPFSNAELDRLYANIPPTAQQDARSREAFKRIARIVEDGHDIRSYQTKEPTNDR